MRKALLLAALGVLLTGPRASAHALLESSEPSDGSTVEAAPGAVTLTFTEEPDPKLTIVRVLDESGSPVPAGDPSITGRTVRLDLRLPGDGAYTVTWRTVSQVDGHATAGAVAFGVGTEASPVASQRQQVPGPDARGTAGRVLLYAGLGVLIGGGGLSRMLAADLRRLLLVAWLAGAAGLVLLAWSQQIAAGVGPGELLGTSVGRGLLARAVPLVAAGVAIARGGGGRAWTVAGVLAAGVLFAHVSYGHAATGALRWPKVAAQWAHACAFGVWIGGLVSLVVATRRATSDARADAVRRYSRLAAYALLVLAATGTARAVSEVRSWKALATTGFGRLVLAKIALLAVIAVLGAVNRYRSVPAAATTLRPLRRISSVEIALAAVVLVLTGFLSATAPPATRAAAAPSGLRVDGSDFGTTVRVSLRIDPGRLGSNAFEADVRDYDTREPVAADAVVLRFSHPDAGPSVLDLERRGTTWSARGTNLSIAGSWTVTVVVERGAGSAEVPLEVRVAAAIRVVRVPGQPDISTVPLGGGRAVQAYLDPGRPGPNELHATFFDGARELEVRDLRITANGEPLDVSMLGPGHGVAGRRFDAGRWRFELSATDTSGAPLRTSFELRIPSGG